MRGILLTRDTVNYLIRPCGGSEMNRKPSVLAQFDLMDQDVLTNNRDAICIRIYATCPQDRGVTIDSVKKIMDYAHSLGRQGLNVFIVELRGGEACPSCDVRHAPLGGKVEDEVEGA